MANEVNRAYDANGSWHRLQEEKRRSNLAHARALHNRFRKDGKWADASAEREREAECEHRRWRAYALTTGFTSSADPALVNRICLPQVADPVKLKDLAKADPYLGEYDGLEDDIKDYDRRIVDHRKSILAAFDSCRAPA
jgi:hypothetical protein